MSILSLKALSDVIDKLKAAAAPDMARIQADTMAYGQAFYRVREDGSFRHVPAADVLADPGIPVTDEMNAAGRTEAARASATTVYSGSVSAIYRAMAAVAPKFPDDPDRVATLAQKFIAKDARIATLESENACLSHSLRAATEAHAELEAYGRARILAHQSSEGDWREVVDAKDARIAELKSELAAMRVAPTTKPTDAQLTPGDASATAPPERRADGTLKPVARAWEAPKQASDPRRIGA